MVDTSMQDAAEKRRNNPKKIDKSMEDAIVNMSPVELAEYFTELKTEGYDDDAISQLRAKAAENLATAGGGKASEFVKQMKDKREAAEAEAAEEEAQKEKEEPVAEEPKKDMYADEEKPAKKTTKKKSSKKKKPDPAPEEPPVAEEPEVPAAPPTGDDPDDAEPVEAGGEGAEDAGPSAMERFTGKASDDGDDDGPALLIPEKNNFLVCEAVPDGYEDIGNIVSGPWETMDDVKSSIERYVLDNEDADIDGLYVVKVVKLVEFKKVVTVAFK